MTERKRDGLDLDRDQVDPEDLDLGGFRPRQHPPSHPPEPDDRAAKEAGFTTRHAPPPAQDSKPVSGRVDGRSLRTTNRTTQLNIAVSEETRDRFWTLAHAAGVQAGEDFLIRLMDGFVGNRKE